MPTTKGNKQVVELTFPFNGLNENISTRRPIEDTTPDALNVRPYDPIDNRKRGGQRPGTDKYVAAQLNGNNAIQRIDQLTVAFDPALVEADELLLDEDFTGYVDGRLETVSSGDWEDWGDTGSIIAIVFQTGDDGDSSGEFLTVTDSTDTASQSVASGGPYAASKYAGGVTLGDVYVIRINVSLAAGSSNINSDGAIILRVGNVDDSDQYNIQISLDGTASADNPLAYAVSEIDNNSITATLANGSLGTSTTPWVGMLEVRVSGNTLSIYFGTSEPLTFLTTVTMTKHVSNTGFMVGLDSTTIQSARPTMSRVRVWSGVSPASLRTTKLIGVAGGTILAGNADGMTTPTGGSSALITSGRVDSASALQRTYFVDGILNNYSVYDPVADTVSTWLATSGALPTGGTGVANAITAVDTGTSTFTVAESLSLSDGDYIEIRGSTGNDGSYTVASTNGTTNIVVDQTIQDSTVDGNLHIAGAACRIITNYRGRIVMSALETDPHNWFMSAVNAPLDWDYFPATTNQTQAVAGNNSDAGKLGDIITALIPYSDDLLIMGGDHTIWVLRGDPAAGGVIDNISYQTGISGPDAWAFDPDGNLYFLGANTLWILAAGAQSQPVPISRDRLDTFLSNINYNTDRVRLVWDRDQHGLHIFVTPTSKGASAPKHFWYCKRTNGFWPMSYPNDQGPTAAFTFDADDPDDRAVLIGTWDGYIRYLNEAATDDDGTAINSYVTFAPMMLSTDEGESKITKITPIMATGSSPVRLEVYAGETAEDVTSDASGATPSPTISQTLTAGRNSPMLQRIRGGAVVVRLENDSATTTFRWAMESIAVAMSPAGQRRQH